jgi:hypothetical protein
MRQISRSEQLFAAVNDLIAQLRVEGRAGLADELTSAWGTFAGSAGGWALFVEAVDAADAGLSSPSAAPPESRRR